jgi:hypothetical protein
LLMVTHDRALADELPESYDCSALAREVAA